MRRLIRPLILSMSVLGISAVTLSAQTTDLTLSLKPKGNGAVFVMTNDAQKNEVIAYDRAANGYLTEAGRYDTQGRGSGGVTDPLEAQGSLTLSQDHSVLFAANAGSGNISVFSVRKSNLTFVSKTASGGSQPVAVAQSGSMVYVLNAGGAGSVVGFRLDLGAQLKPIRNSTAFLTANVTGGASIAFSPDGRFLLVTERLANNVDAFSVKPDGTLAPIVVNSNPVAGTFSINFAPNGQAILSATGAADVSNGSTISSFSVTGNGQLTPISLAVPTLGNANCWNAITPDGRYVYVSNSSSDSISGFAIGKDGSLTPLGSTVVGNNPGGSTNLDIAVSADARFIYTLNSATGNIGMFRIEDNGTLTNLGQAGDLPKSVGFNGIAAI